MSGMALIIASAFAIGLCALALLLWTLSSGQYDDLDGDAARILIDAHENTAVTGSPAPDSRDVR